MNVKKFNSTFKKFGCDQNVSGSFAWLGLFVGKRNQKIHVALSEEGRIFVGKKAEEFVSSARKEIKELAVKLNKSEKNLN